MADKRDTKRAAPRWKLVTRFDVTTYRCGLKAGQKVRLRKDLPIREHGTEIVVRTLMAGQVWTVLPGSHQDPGVVFFLREDGKKHTWDDDPGIFETLERLESP